MSSPESRKSLSYVTVALGFFGLLAVGIGFGLFIYFRFVSYDRVAAQHIPANSTVAVRVDVEKVVLFEPVRKHFFPLFDEAFSPRAAKLASRRERLATHTGVQLGRDLREIVWASGPSDADWLVIVAGKFPKDGIVRGLSELLREEGHEWNFHAGSRRLTAPNGVVVAQASDGALIVASSGARLEAAIPSQTGYEALGVPAEGSGGFAVSKLFFSGPLASLCGTEVTLPSGIDSLEHVSGGFEVGKTIDVSANVRVKSGQASTLKPQVRALLELFGRLAPLGTASRPLGRAELVEQGANELSVTTRWERGEVDTLASNIADALRAWLRAETHAVVEPGRTL